MAVLVSKAAGNITSSGNWYTTISSHLGGGSTGASTALNSTTYIVKAMTFSTSSVNLKGWCMGVSYNANTLPSSSTMAGLEICLDQIMGDGAVPVTMTIANPCVVTWNTHGFSNGQAVRFTTTGALPTGITAANTIYYAGNVAANTFNLYDTYANAIASGVTGRITTTGTQSGVHTLKAIRLQATPTAAQICDAGTRPDGQWLFATEFGTANVPATTYPVDNTVGRWEIIWRESSSQSTHWTWLCDSNATTAMHHVAYTDTTASYVDNTDQIVCKDQITVTAATTFKGALWGTTTDYSVCGWLCKSPDFATAATRPMLIIDQGAAAFTVTFDGSFCVSGHSGIRVGSSGTPVPLSKQITLQGKRVQTAGTAAAWMIQPTGAYSGMGNFYSAKSSFECYGATTTPLYVWTKVTVQAAASQPSVTVSDASNFAANDIVQINNANPMEILSVVGNVITFKTNFAAIVSVGTFVIRIMNSSGAHYYPILLTRDTLATSGGLQSRVIYLGELNILTLIGVELYACSIMSNSLQSAGGADDSQWLPTPGYYFYYVQNTWGTYENSWASTSGLVAQLHHACSTPRNGLTAQYIVSTRGNGALWGIPRMADTSTWNGVTQLGGTYQITDYVTNAAIGNFNTATVFPKMVLTRNYYSGGGGSGIGFMFGGGNSTMDNCEFFATTGTGATPSIAFNLCAGGLYNAVIRNNLYTGQVNTISLNQATVNCIEINPTYTSCTNDYLLAGVYTDWEVNSPNSTSNPTTTNQSVMIPGSKFRITDDNNVSNADYVYRREGKFVRCGYGLSDTTVRTSGTTFGAASSGKFSLRLDSNGVETLTFSQVIPIGNIIGRTMVVSVWAKINAAAYYAGTYTLPILRVNYDNGTIAYAQMANDASAGQLLSVPFVPTTSYGQITVTLECKTDATGTNNRVYFDDFSVQYPAGYSLDLGAMDLWANAEPIKPTIATLANVGQVWDELTSSHPTAGTFGAQATQMAIQTDDNQALILTK